MPTDKCKLYYKMWDSYWLRYRLIPVGYSAGLGPHGTIYECHNPAFMPVGTKLLQNKMEWFIQGSEGGYVAYIVDTSVTLVTEGTA